MKCVFYTNSLHLRHVSKRVCKKYRLVAFYKRIKCLSTKTRKTMTYKTSMVNRVFYCTHFQFWNCTFQCLMVQGIWQWLWNFDKSTRKWRDRLWKYWFLHCSLYCSNRGNPSYQISNDSYCNGTHCSIVLCEFWVKVETQSRIENEKKLRNFKTTPKSSATTKITLAFWKWLSYIMHNDLYW